MPYQRYGHVILVEPNPVLLYQISPTETRVLVDVPSEIAVQGGDVLVKYFMETVAPQVWCAFPVLKSHLCTQFPENTRCNFNVLGPCVAFC